MLEPRSEETDAPGPDDPDGPGDAEGRDDLSDALEELAVSAEQTAAEQQQLADSARAMSRRRQHGRSWAAILAGDEHPSVLTLLSSSLRRLSETSSLFRTAIVAALAHEGLSTRQIAARLGVTHQRVSAMLARFRS